MKIQKWYDYLWIGEILYFLLGFYNILFAWLGMIMFLTPLGIAIIAGNKNYCNKYCGRGQLLSKLGNRFSWNKPLPLFMRTNSFRYAFLIFFMAMFINMLYITYLVAQGAVVGTQSITLLWSIDVPWAFANPVGTTSWLTQYAFGFYSVMLTSAILGIFTMAIFRPRGFCVYCPMGTMTQGICKIKHRGEEI